MHNIYIVARKLKSNSHDQQKCKMIKTLVLLVCQLTINTYLSGPYFSGLYFTKFGQCGNN